MANNNCDFETPADFLTTEASKKFNELFTNFTDASKSGREPVSKDNTKLTNSEIDDLNRGMKNEMIELHKKICDEVLTTTEILPGDSREEAENKLTFFESMKQSINKLFDWLKEKFENGKQIIIDAYEKVKDMILEAIKDIHSLFGKEKSQ